MALMSCEECGNQISNRAVACPKCGCPVEEIVQAEIIQATAVDNRNELAPPKLPNTATGLDPKESGYSARWVFAWFLFTFFTWLYLPRVNLYSSLVAMLAALIALPKLLNSQLSFAIPLHTACCQLLGCRKHFGGFAVTRVMFIGFWGFIIAIVSNAELSRMGEQRAKEAAATEQAAGLIEAAEAELESGSIKSSKKKLTAALAIPGAKNKSDLIALRIKIATRESQQLYEEGMKLLKQGKLDAAKKVIREASRIPDADNDDVNATSFALSIANDKQQIKQAVSKLNRREFDAVTSSKKLPKRLLLGIDEIDLKSNKLLAEVLPAIESERLRKENERRKIAEATKLRKEAEARKAANEINFNGLVLFKNSQQGSPNQITGQVENRKGRKLNYVQIQYNLYDTSGAHIGTAFTNTTGLENGRIWKFQAHILGKKYATYKLNSLTGY